MLNTRLEYTAMRAGALFDSDDDDQLSDHHWRNFSMFARPQL